MNQKTYKIITITLLVAVVLLTGYILTRKPTVTNTEEQLKLKSDSLQRVLGIVKDSADKKEKVYLLRIDSIVTYQKKVIRLMNSRSKDSIEKVKELPLDEAINYFSTHTYQESAYPKKLSMGMDTVVMITQEQLEESNMMFEEMNSLYDIKDTLDSQLEVTYKLLEESKGVLNIKNNQISVLNELSSVKSNIISFQDETILKLKKTHKKQMFLNTLISVGVGSILGAIFIK